MEALSWDWNFHYETTIAALTYSNRVHSVHVYTVSCMCVLGQMKYKVKWQRVKPFKYLDRPWGLKYYMLVNM